MAHSYPYPRPALTVDTVLVAQAGLSKDQAKILLIQRGKDPFAGTWALPGGFVDEGEGLAAAARRELIEETAVDAGDVKLAQLGAFGDPGRDPRGWVLTVAYGAVIPSAAKVEGGDDAREAKWFPVTDLPALAFDHKTVIRHALERLADIHKALPQAFLRHLLAAAVRLK